MKLNKIIQSYKNTNMNKELLSYKLKKYYNLNENERLIVKNNMKFTKNELNLMRYAQFDLIQEAWDLQK